MIQRIVDGIIEKQVEHQTITKEEINIYKYGYFLLLEVFINVIISISVGLVFNDLKTVLMFLILYIPLRSYSGGWHADKLWKCTVISNMILVIIEVISNYCLDYITVRYCIPLAVILAIYILLLSPVDTEAKPLSKEEREVYKNKVKVIVFFHTIVLMLCVFLKNEKGIIVVEYTYLVQAVMVMAERVKKY